MQLGLFVRNMGPQSTRASLVACARAAEAAGVDDLWVADHIAIPPDDAEGSDGRYLDPLATLAFLAAATDRIRLGTGVLVLPYRPALPTAKWIATIQELSQDRLLLGVGAGWMEAEFRALGVPRARRGAVTDETLGFLVRCFAADEVEAHGQRFVFRPRPQRPPIFVGGAPPHALRRAVRYGDGWMPIALDAAMLTEPIAALQRRARAAGRDALDVVLVTTLPVDDRVRARDVVQELAGVGVTRVVHGWRYADAGEFARVADGMGTHLRAALGR